MIDKKKTLFAISTLAIAVLAGCATDVESTDEQSVVAPATESESATPQQINLTGPCTTTTSCDVNYCCTTTDCRFTTTVNCTPRVKAIRSALIAP